MSVHFICHDRANYTLIHFLKALDEVFCLCTRRCKLDKVCVQNQARVKEIVLSRTDKMADRDYKKILKTYTF